MNSKIEIVDCKSICKDKIYDYAAKHSDSFAFHHPAWDQVLEDVFSVEVSSLAAICDSGNVIGCLPLYSSRSRVLGSHVAAADGGPIGDNEQIRQALADKALDIALQKKVKFLNLKCDVAFGDIKSVEMPCVWPYKELNYDIDELYKTLHKKTRWMIRKGEQNNVEVVKTNGGLRSFYRVFSRRMRDLGTPVVPYTMFESMQKCFGSDMSFYYLHKGEECLGGMVCIRLGETLYSMQAATDMAYKDIFPNYVLYWAVIRSAAIEGLKYFHLGRSPLGSGTMKFKRKWTKEAYERTYLVHLLSGKTSDFGKIHSQESLSQRIWKKLPLAVANQLGPQLRKQLPFL